MKILCRVDSCKADLFCTWCGVWVTKETSSILAQHSLINSNIWDPYSLWHIAIQLKITVQVDMVTNTVYCWDCETVNTSLFSVTYRLPFIRTHASYKLVSKKSDRRIIKYTIVIEQGKRYVMLFVLLIETLKCLPLNWR